MKGFPILSGLQLRRFLDTTGEVHALTQGFCEVLCPWPPRHRLMSKQMIKELQREHHYYMLGRARRSSPGSPYLVSSRRSLSNG